MIGPRRSSKFNYSCGRANYFIDFTAINACGEIHGVITRMVCGPVIASISCLDNKIARLCAIKCRHVFVLHSLARMKVKQMKHEARQLAFNGFF